jgi:hypothetical protein
MKKCVIFAVTLLLIISFSLISGFSTAGEFPSEGYIDPSNDLIYSHTGKPVPPEKYVGYLDVIGCEVELTLDSINFRTTLNEGIPPLKYTTFWTILIDVDGSPENNCPDYPYNDADTMYSVKFCSIRGWELERSTYRSWGWDMAPTDATWGITSSWPEGKPQISISIPLYEMPEVLPWKVLTECTGTYITDLAPDTERYYTRVVTVAEWFYIEGVFQPVQVVYQHDELYGDNMTYIKPYEWKANISMVQGKNTLLFGYPYGSRNVIRFNVTNGYSEKKSFTLKFWVQPGNKLIHETTTFTVDKFSTSLVELPAPIPWDAGAGKPKPFQFTEKGNARIDVQVVPAPGSEPLESNNVTVYVEVKKTWNLHIVFACIQLFNGTAGNQTNLHDPVSKADADKHAEEAVKFMTGTYPVAENGISYNVFYWIPINHTEVRRAPTTVNVNLSRVLDKIDDYAVKSSSAIKFIVVGLVPSNWMATYLGSPNTAGIMLPSNRYAVLVSEPYWTATAHEIGHTFGLWIGTEFPRRPATISEEDWEEYTQHPDDGMQAPGYWVNLAVDKLPSDTFCFMGTAVEKNLDTRWIDKKCYQWLLFEKFVMKDPDVIFVQGIAWLNGTICLGNWYHLPYGYTDITERTIGNYSIIFLNQDGQTLSQYYFNLEFITKELNPREIDETSFAFMVPYPSWTAKIHIKHKNVLIAERVVSKNPPAVSVTYPIGGEILSPKQPLNITWDAYDPDGDTLTYLIAYSKDSGGTWLPLASNIQEKFYVWNTSLQTPRKNYLIKVIATDGVNVGEDVSDNSFTITFQGDLDTDGSVNIYDIFILAKAFGTYPGHPRWNPKADIDGNNKVDISDVFAMAKQYGKTI